MDENVAKTIDELVENVFEYCYVDDEEENKEECELQKLIASDTSRKEQLKPILKEIILSKDKNGIKENLKNLIKKLKEFGVKIESNSEESNSKKNSYPVLWSNGRPDNEFENESYNSQKDHFDDEASPLFGILWEIFPNIFNKLAEIEENKVFKVKEELNDTYIKKMYEQANSEGIPEHIPYDRLLSELWVEEMPLDSILKGEIRIEFGQNNQSNIKEKKIYSPTDSVLSVSELPILLDRIAQHNINMDLAGTPEKKVYLENIGVSAEEIINEKYKSIDERYAEGKDNPGTGYLLLRKAERGENGEISKTSISTPIQLRYLILKLEKQRLKEINQRLDKTKKITKEDIKIETQQ